MKKLFVISIILMLSLCGCASSKGLTENEMRAEGQAFVEQINNREFVNAVEKFNKEMIGAMDADGLEETWVALETQVGEFDKILTDRIDKINDYDVVYVTTAFAESDIDIRIAFDSEGKIAGLYFAPAEEIDTEKALDEEETDDN